jgi:hypothetical protein
MTLLPKPQQLIISHGKSTSLRRQKKENNEKETIKRAILRKQKNKRKKTKKRKQKTFKPTTEPKKQHNTSRTPHQRYTFSSNYWDTSIDTTQTPRTQFPVSFLFFDYALLCVVSVCMCCFALGWARPAGAFRSVLPVCVTLLRCVAVLCRDAG